MSFGPLPPYSRNITKVTVIGKERCIGNGYEIRKISKCKYRKVFWAIKVL